ncbi:MAG: KdsC family phosphatase [Janthinobacterium lividum]
MATPHTALERARNIRLAIFDVDGVLTDGGLWFGPQGEVIKHFNSLDGHGMKLLGEAGIVTAIITGRRSEIVAARAAEMRVTHVYQGISQKLVTFKQLLDVARCDPAAVAYMGDDWPDLAVMGAVGFAAAPANAHVEVRRRAHWVAQAAGGHGAVRELCDLLLQAGGHYDAMLAHATRG